jgi:hypothetical protein
LKDKDQIAALREITSMGAQAWQEIRDDSISKLKETYSAVTSGFVDSELQAERYAICEKCEAFRPSVRQCKSCMCFMPAKTLFNKSTCPKGYWNK